MHHLKMNSKKTKKTGVTSFKVFCEPIFGQFFHFIPPENTGKTQRFCGVFNGYKMGTLVRNE